VVSPKKAAPDRGRQQSSARSGKANHRNTHLYRRWKMNTRFERTGPLTELTSYPQWAQDMVADCEAAKQGVVRHEMWDLMREASLSQTATRHFMVGIWPVIERFPAYMALSLLKTRFGRSPGDNLARRWLVRNIRVEQNHAEYWLNWAEGAGVEREDVLNGRAPHGTGTLADWCEEICASGSLAASIAATNYAVEGATGEWSQRVYESKAYAESFAPKERAGSLRWLQLHAAYDDTHPWEALEIVCTLMGTTPAAHDVEHIASCIKRSYVSMRISMDHCIGTRYELEALREAAA
jgi:pyrroloquinoline quinone (PQQ) biosynthesis protein C